MSHLLIWLWMASLWAWLFLPHPCYPWEVTQSLQWAGGWCTLLSLSSVHFLSMCQMPCV